ncbi:MerR family transcriptional regulator [Clostridium hydrogenum]|nr:MerR family transcriptional regulator [Clostridium hydrogenum]
MNKYFTISEFADLRGININSLRYYEKIGVLKPAYIDSQTNYRYYSTEQLLILNQIILCITIGIPLKELKHYIGNDGKLNSKELLQQGQIMALLKMKEIQNNLNMISHMLESIEKNKTFENMQGKYVRQIKERRIITSDFISEELDDKEIVRRIAVLYKYALKNDLVPMLPAGKIIKITTDGKISLRLFLEILNTDVQNDNITIIPQGDYDCLQTILRDREILRFVQEQNMHGKTIIVDNIKLPKYSFDTKPSELQIFCTK